MTKNSIMPVGLAALVAIGGWKAYEAGIFDNMNERVLAPIADKYQGYKVGLDDNPSLLRYGGNADANNIGGCGMGLGAIALAAGTLYAMKPKKEKKKQ